MASFLDSTGLSHLIEKIKAAFIAKTDTTVATSIGIDSTPTTNSTNLVTSGGVKSALDNKANSSDLSTVATTGSYNDLSNKPTIPDDSDLVHTTGDEQISGNKTFRANGNIRLLSGWKQIYNEDDSENLLRALNLRNNVQSDWNATTGDAVILNKPTIPTVNNSTITILKNGSTVNSFTLNQSSNKTINITVPTTASDVSALPASTKYGASLSVSIDSTTYVVTALLKDLDGNNLGTAQTIDLPLESVVVSGSYDSATKKVVLTLKDGSTIDFSIADLVSGLLTEITSTNKLSADLVEDGTTNKVYTATEKTKLSGIASGAEVNVQSNWNETNTSSDAYILNKPTIPNDSNLVHKTGNETISGTKSFQSDAGHYTSIDSNIEKVFSEAPLNYWGWIKITGKGGLNETLQQALDARNNVQADWNETTTTSAAYIQNKPDIVQSNSPFKQITISGWTNNIVVGDAVSIGRTNSKIEIGSNGGDNDTIRLTTSGSDGGVYVSTDTRKFYYNNKEVATKNDIPTVYAWALAATKPSYTASEVGAVPTTRTVNGKALSADISLTASDVNALPSSTVIPAAQVNSDWSATSGVAQILNKPTIPLVLDNPQGTETDAAPSVRYVENIRSEVDFRLHVDGTSIDVSADDDLYVKSLNADKLTNGTNNKVFTSAEQLKLTGIEIGAQVNVQSDWNETNVLSDAYILNKPTIPDITGKADKVSSAVEGNFASLDSNGNLEDSGYSYTDCLNELSDLYAPATESSELEPGDTFEEAFGKLEKTVTDNEYITAQALNDLNTNKQDTLESGTNIKTINGESILGSGDFNVTGDCIAYPSFEIDSNGHLIMSGGQQGLFTLENGHLMYNF